MSQIPIVLDLSSRSLRGLDRIGKFDPERVVELHLQANDLGPGSCDEIVQFSSLQRLHLDCNPLMRLPTELGRLAQLRVLTAESAGLLSWNAQELVGCPVLATLGLGDNRIEGQLGGSPDALSRLVALEHVRVSGNLLTSLDGIQACSKLLTLHVARNALRALPPLASLTSLTHLDLDSNRLTTLPAELAACRALVVLSASQNEISTIHTDFSMLGALRILVLDSNQITSVPDSIRRCGRTLTTLHLANNSIQAFPGWIRPSALSSVLPAVTSWTLHNNPGYSPALALSPETRQPIGSTTPPTSPPLEDAQAPTSTWIDDEARDCELLYAALRDSLVNITYE